MDYRTLDLTLVSAKGLTKASSISSKSNVYAVASISGTVSNLQKFKTPIVKDGGSNPTWNCLMKFNVNEAARLQNRLILVIKLKAARMFVDKKLVEVRMPIKGLLEGAKSEGKPMQTVSYAVRGRYGELKGVLIFSNSFGKISTPKVEEPVTRQSVRSIDRALPVVCFSVLLTVAAVAVAGMVTLIVDVAVMVFIQLRNKNSHNV